MSEAPKFPTWMDLDVVRAERDEARAALARAESALREIIFESNVVSSYSKGDLAEIAAAALAARTPSEDR